VNGSDLEIRVRVRADGGGLAGQLAQDEAALRRFKDEAAQVPQRAGGVAEATSRIGQASRRSAADVDAASGAFRRSAEAQGASAREAHANANSVRQQGGAYQELGSTVAAAVQQIIQGSAPLDLLSQRSAGAGDSMDRTATRAGILGGVVGGGLAGAIDIGVGALVTLIASLFEAGEAAKTAETGADALGRAQSVMGEMFDLASGKIERQNGLLLANIRLTAIQLRAEAQRQRYSANRTLNEALEPRGGWVGRVHDDVNEFIGGLTGQRTYRQTEVGANILRPHVEAIRRARTPEERAVALDRALRASEFPGGAEPGDTLGNIANVSGDEWRQAVIDLATAEQNESVAGLIDSSLANGRLDPALRREGRQRRPRRARRARVDNRPEQASDAIENIQRIEEQFDDQPRAIDRAVQSMRQLDDILADASRRRLPRMDEMVRGADRARQAIREGIIRQVTEPFREQPRLVQRAEEGFRSLADAAEQLGAGNADFLRDLRAAGEVIEAGLVRPYREFLQDQLRTYETQRLIAEGREDEAAAVGIIHQLEQQLGPLSEDRRRVIVASVAGLRQQAEELQIAQQRQQLFVGFTRDVRGELSDLAGSFPERRLRGLLDLGEGVYSAFNQLRGDVLVERLFGDTFRRFEDIATGRDRVRQANENAASSAETVRQELDRLAGAQGEQVSAVEGVTSAMQRLERATQGAAQSAETAAAGGAAPAVGATAGASTRTAVAIGNPLRSMAVGGEDHQEHVRRGSHGVDLRAPAGTEVLAPFAGTLSWNRTERGGLQAFVTSLDGRLRAGFAHLESLTIDNVRQGVRIELGQVFARSGNSGTNPRTGRNVDPHLHGSFYVDGQRVDPMQYYGRNVDLAAEPVRAIARAADDLAAPAGEAAANVQALAGSSTGLADAAQGASAAADDWEAYVDTVRNASMRLFQNNLNDDLMGLGGEERVDEGVVNGRRREAELSPRDFLRTVLTGLTSRIFGAEVGEKVGRYAAQAIEGVGFGRFAAGTLLGRSGSSTGAAIGGAVGQVAGEALKSTMTDVLGKTLGGVAGPLGAAVGGIAGGVIGAAFRSSRTGSASVTSVGGEASLSGNSKGQKSVASGLATGVQDALQQIAEQLGGGLGAFAVSIGVRDDKFRVDPSGKGATKTKKGAVDFGEDQAAAIGFAIADAIKDGAITGLSAAVQKALASSQDINRALREAVKVDELETMLAGFDNEVSKATREFERQAADRRRIAKEYGFDLVELEERTAKDRAKLFSDIITAQVGDLQELLKDLDFGDLFEGSLVDRRQKLLVEIASAEADAKAGVEGAASRVASLRRKLIEVSEEAFGTAGGELAADRASSRSSAEEIIRLENERVKAAQEAALSTNRKLDTSNQHLDEIADQISTGNNEERRQTEVLERMAGMIERLGGGAGFADTGRSTGLR
jgi:murein DD-endopeptidase MepM/ murein hydrolase activator NlpD